MTSYVDHNYFQQLSETAPDVICRGNRCRFDQVVRRFSIDVWGEEYSVDCAGRRIERTGIVHPAAPHEFFPLFVMYYLLLPEDGRINGEWISEKDLPGGATFFRGPHRIPTDLIGGRFGNDIEGFRRCCEGLGGNAIDLGDAAYRFDIVPNIPVVVVLWQGDEDFPAEASLLYDRSIAGLLPLDIVFALAVSVCARVKAAGDCPKD